MSLVTTKEMLENARRGGYAVGAFNAENMEMVMAIIAAATEERSPVIIQTTPSTVKYASLGMFFASVSAVAKDAPVPVALHLDHGNSYELAIAAMDAGYTSVMIDGSHEDFEGNVALTRSVVEIARTKHIPVEGELGSVGGKEDDHEGSAAYTLPDEAREFVQETGVSSLAVAIGTAHGVYKVKPVLDVDRLKRIRKVVSVPLVLHGASGLTDNDVRACVKEGICKVNFATELRAAYTEGVKETIRLNPDVYDPKAYGRAGMQKVKELVKNRIRICGCDKKA